MYDKVIFVPSECLKLQNEQINAINAGAMLDIQGRPTAGG
jgi:hypothetical protein